MNIDAKENRDTRAEVSAQEAGSGIDPSTPPQDAYEQGSWEQLRKRRGAPAGNGNAQRGPRKGLRSQTLSDHHIEHESRALRLEIEAELRAVHGDEISLYHLALVQSLVRHEQLCQLAFKRLRGLPKDAATSDHVSLWSIISKETDARDRCLKLMNLERPSHSNDPWAAITSAPSNPATACENNSAQQSMEDEKTQPHGNDATLKGGAV